jgi:hypothetical protein
VTEQPPIIDVVPLVVWKYGDSCYTFGESLTNGIGWSRTPFLEEVVAGFAPEGAAMYTWTVFGDKEEGVTGIDIRYDKPINPEVWEIIDQLVAKIEES